MAVVGWCSTFALLKIDGPALGRFERRTGGAEKDAPDLQPPSVFRNIGHGVVGLGELVGTNDEWHAGGVVQGVKSAVLN
jgi:hypothetical protein